MATYLIQRTIDPEPRPVIEVDEAEYERLLELGIVVNAPAAPQPADAFDLEVAELIGEVDSATRAAVEGLFPAAGDTEVAAFVANPTSATSTELRAASVAAVEDATTVGPTGAWDFTQAPTVAGAPISGGGGAVASVNGATGVVVLDADDIGDGSAKVTMTAAERTKLGGVATGATANSTDAALRDRALHTGLQTAATISDLREAVEDYVAALLASGTNVTLTYTDNGSGAGSLSIASTGGGTTDPEAVRDAIGVALVGAGLVSVAVNDAADTITISTTATANATDAQLRDRSTHTGAQAISTVTGLQTALDAAVTRVLTKRTITGAYTLVAADAVDMVLHSTSASGFTLTLPQDSAASIAQEIAIPWRQYGAGQITFAAGTGATLISRGSVLKSAGQYAEGLVTKVAANTWLLSGDIVA